MAKFTKKYVRRIKRRRASRKRAKKLSKPMRRAVQKIVNRSSERKVTIETPFRQLIQPTSGRNMYSYELEALSIVPQQQVDPLATTTQYIIQSWREGARIERASFMFRMKVCWDSFPSDEGWCYKATNVNDVPLQIIGKIFVRIVAWKPKIFSDIATGKTYMRNNFGPIPELNGSGDVTSTTAWQNMYGSIDPTVITVIKDTGCRMFEDPTKLHLNFYFKQYYKSLRYDAPQDNLPDDRRPQITLMVAAQEDGRSLFNWVERTAYFHDQ